MAQIRHDGGPQEANLVWLPEGEARFQFWQNDWLVVGRVSRDALDEKFGPRASAEEYLELVSSNFQHAVTDSIGRLAALGRFEADGTVLLRPGQWMY